MKLYLDSSAVIYAIEVGGAARSVVIQRVIETSLGPGGTIVTSRLTRLECRVKPLRLGDAALLARYDGFFASIGAYLLEVTPSVLELATTLRADHRFRTPDAIHLASAIDAEAQHFLTGDAELAKCPGLHFELLKP